MFSVRIILYFDCEFFVNERDEVDNFEFWNVFKMNIFFEVNGKISGFGVELRFFVNCYIYLDIRFWECLLYFLLFKFKNEDCICFGRV